jgi:hypothetical protein
VQFTKGGEFSYPFFQGKPRWHFQSCKKTMIATFIPMFGAIGFSIIYLLLGGGLGGAFLIFIIAKMFGK